MSAATSIAWIELGGDPDRVRDWLGEEGAQIRLLGGDVPAYRCAVKTARGEQIIKL